MIKQIAVGLVAGALAVIVLAWARPAPSPPLWLGAESIQVDERDSGDLVPDLVPPVPATRPATVPAELEVRLPRVHYAQTPFSKVIDDLREASGANIVVHWRALEGAGIDAAAPVTVELADVPLHQVLTEVLRDVGGSNVLVEHRVDGNVITISIDDEFEQYVLRVYDVRDLVVEGLRSQRSFTAVVASTTRRAMPSSVPVSSEPLDPEQRVVEDLVRAVSRAERHQIWDGGPFVSHWAGRLVVSGMPGQHQHIESVLRELRRNIQNTSK